MSNCTMYTVLALTRARREARQRRTNNRADRMVFVFVEKGV